MGDLDIKDRRRWAAEAVEEIRADRAAAGDENLSELPEHPLDVVRYIHSHRRVRAEVRRGEWLPGWQLLDHLEREITLARLGMLEAAAAAGLSYADVGRLLKVTRQAVDAMRCRLESARDGGPKREGPARAARAHRRETTRRKLSAAQVLIALARTLFAAQDQMPADLAEACGADVEELEAELALLRPGGPPSDKLAADVALICRELVGRPIDAPLRTAIVGGAQRLQLPLPGAGVRP